MWTLSKPLSQQQRYTSCTLLLASVLLLAGCATTRETPIRELVPSAHTNPVRVGVLPPEISPSLSAENVRPESSWFVRFFWMGRGAVITSSELQNEFRLFLISYLTIGKKYYLVFPVKTVEEARERGADCVLSCRVNDARTVLLGPNRRFFWVMLTPLPTQYFIRCLTLEARLDWDVEVVELNSETTILRHWKQAKYRKTVRYSFPSHFEPKMWNYLRYEALPSHFVETFALSMEPTVTPSDK